MLVGEVLGHLHRLRRPLSLGLFAILGGVVALLVSPLAKSYTGIATLAIPTNPDKAPEKGGVSVAGIGVGDFRLMTKALQDPGTLAAHFPGGPDPDELARRIPLIVLPIFATDVPPGNPIPADARVLAVELSAGGGTERDANVFLDQLTSAARDVLANLLEDSWLRQVRVGAASRREGLMARIQGGERERLGYLRLAAALSQIPNAAGPANGLREVVDTNGGGHRYLPLPVQVNGVRVAIAEIENDLRLARAELIEVNALDAFVGRVSDRAAAASALASPVVNVTSIIAEEVKALEASPEGSLAAQAQVVERVKSTVDFFRMRRGSMDLIQRPTIHFNRNYTLPVAFGLLGILTWFALVLLRDSWKRHGARAYDAADRDGQTS